MHISEGVLSPEVLAVGGAATLAGAAWGLKKLQQEDLPKVALMSAAFFVASLIHVPLGPASLHLVLGGLVGLLLGWSAFPAILVALALQALLFSFGGLVVLGANTLIMALPALICHWLFSPLARSSHRVTALGGAALAGGGDTYYWQAFCPPWRYTSAEKPLSPRPRPSCWPTCPSRF